MIFFSRSGKQVKASFEYISGGINTKLFFYWQCEHEETADALTDKLQDSIDKTIEREIKTAYEAGYKAGRQKKTKRTWFHNFLTHINESLPDWKKND